MFKSLTRAQGFSGLEMLIVFVVVGLAFSMALKGEAFLLKMRAFMTARQLEQYANQILVYEATYSALPGDDAQAPLRFNRENALVNTEGFTVSLAGDGKVDGKLSDALTPNSETFMAWRDLRYAGLIDGDAGIAGASAMPENPFGGIFGLDENNLGLGRLSLCATRIPGVAAKFIDQQLDNGVVNTGRMVATSKYDAAGAFNHFDAPDSAPYSVEKEYIICMPVRP